MGPELQIRINLRSGSAALGGGRRNFFGTGHLGYKNADFVKNDQRTCHQSLGENIRGS